MSALDLGICLTNDSIKQSTSDRDVLVRSKSKWMSSSETLESLTNSNDVPSFSADGATSDSEFDEHPYSIPKRAKTSNFNYCKKTVLQAKYATNRLKSKKVMSEDNEYLCQSDLPNIIKSSDRPKFESSKTRRRGSKCESKNAVMARLNRLKKKKYVTDLEVRNAKLEAENESLKQEIAKRLKEVSSLKRETINLHSVIKNSTEIGSLLQCVQKNTNLHVTSSLLRNEPPSEQYLHPNNYTSHRTTVSPQPAMDELTDNDEALVAAVLWGMALHLICQPYKQNASNDNVSVNSNKSDKTVQADESQLARYL